MLKLKYFVAASLAAIFLSGASFAALNIQNHDAVGGVATTPWLTEGERVTVTTLTNSTTNWIVVHVTAFDQSWNVIDFDCQLSPMETTYFLFETAANGAAKVTSECSFQGTFNLNIIQTRFIQGGQNGFVIFHATAGLGGTDRSLIADFSVLDFDGGYAFSANGYHFQRNFPQQNLLLNLPATLATSFIAPDDDITAELILFTTNGVAGGPAPARLGGNVFDDDETPLSSFYEYDCFSVVSLETIFGPNVRRTIGPAGFPYFVGHVTLVAQFLAAGQSPFSPFVPFGFQRVPSLGYIVQTIASGGDLNDNVPLGANNSLGGVMAANGAWARKMLRTADSEEAGTVIDPNSPNPFAPPVVP